jgi:hypothetical protein
MASAHYIWVYELGRKVEGVEDMVESALRSIWSQQGSHDTDQTPHIDSSTTNTPARYSARKSLPPLSRYSSEIHQRASCLCLVATPAMRSEGGEHAQASWISSQYVAKAAYSAMELVRSNKKDTSIHRDTRGQARGSNTEINPTLRIHSC